MDFLLRPTDSAAFLIQAEPFLRALRTEPRLAAYLDDVLKEVVRIVDAMEEVDEQLTSELLDLQRELVELRPEADDSKPGTRSESSSEAVKVQARLSYKGTLAYFDKWANSEPEPFDVDGKGGLAKTLVGILQNKDTAYLREVAAAAARDSSEAGADREGFRRRGSPARGTIADWGVSDPENEREGVIDGA